MSLSKARADLEAQIGKQTFEGEWMAVDQERIDAFAEAFEAENPEYAMAVGNVELSRADQLLQTPSQTRTANRQ